MDLRAVTRANRAYLVAMEVASPIRLPSHMIAQRTSHQLVSSIKHTILKARLSRASSNKVRTGNLKDTVEEVMARSSRTIHRRRQILDGDEVSSISLFALLAFNRR